MYKKSDLKLVSPDHPILNKIPQKWDFNVDGSGEMFANILYDRMVELGGIGLSANQLGVDKQVFAMGMHDFKKIMFNPEIVSISNDEVSIEEGCLSFPGIFMHVKRPSKLTIKYQDHSGEYVEEEYTGMTARVVLHEFDHMNGVLFNEKVSKLKWDIALKKKAKKIKRIIKHHTIKQIVNIHKDMKAQENV